MALPFGPAQGEAGMPSGLILLEINCIMEVLLGEEIEMK